MILYCAPDSGGHHSCNNLGASHLETNSVLVLSGHEGEATSEGLASLASIKLELCRPKMAFYRQARGKKRFLLLLYIQVDANPAAAGPGTENRRVECLSVLRVV